MNFKVKMLSSLNKVFAEPEEPGVKEFTCGTALAGEVYSFQIAYYSDTTINDIELKISSPLKEYLRVRKVGLVPAEYLAPDFDDTMLRVTPGLFPDPLLPFDGKIKIFPLQWRSLWFTVALPATCPQGTYPVVVEFIHKESDIHRTSCFELKVLPAVLPEQTLCHTEWFHADCIAVQYKVAVWSEPHWKLLAAYFTNMAEHGINYLLTPLFTLPLDTGEGGERPTAQLVDVHLDDRNGYSFDFTRLKRWIDTAAGCGISNFEMSHLFTQWGAKFAPKIIVNHNGVDEKKFGWHTEALSDEYLDFLKAFLPELMRFLDGNHIKDKCRFHISDEPHPEDIEHFSRVADFVTGYIPGHLILDAVSKVDFYTKGICLNPVPSIADLTPFIEQNIENLWTYYCCGPWENAPNRYFNMPLARTRSLGLILYKYNLCGFLHWGYNFWFKRYSRGSIDPFRTTDAGGEFPAGDPFLVYPGPEGPIDSIRFEALREGFQDYYALKLLERAIGRKETLTLLEDEIGYPVTDTAYPKTEEDFLCVRNMVNKMLQRHYARINAV